MGKTKEAVEIKTTSESGQKWTIPVVLCSPCLQYFRVSIPPAVMPTLLRQMDMGSLTWAQSWVRAVHTNGGETQTSLHKR